MDGRMGVRRRGGTKNPPIFSHEFVIQNHADIVACVAMVFVVGLMFQASSPLASLFVALQHNVSLPASAAPGQPVLPSGEVLLYRSGPGDFPVMFFYFLIVIVMHQIVQEYSLDKINRKLHLSKAKHAKFNESGQLLAFYLLSLFWGGDILLREFSPSPRSLWEGYPHVNMSFSYKFFFIIQIAYWLHVFPELYFQKVKREDMLPRILQAAFHLLLIGGAYALSFTRIALVLMTVQYLVRALFHACRLLAYAEKTCISEPLFLAHDLLFVLARLGSITLAVLTFWYGLALSEDKGLDIVARNFNTALIRFNALLVICAWQAYSMWNFITLQIKLKRERKAASSGSGVSFNSDKKSRSKTQQEKAAKRKEKQVSKKEEGSEDVNELTEVDQNTKNSLRQRK